MGGKCASGCDGSSQTAKNNKPTRFILCVSEDKKQNFSRLIRNPGYNQVRDSQCKFVSDHYVGLA